MTSRTVTWLAVATTVILFAVGCREVSGPDRAIHAPASVAKNVYSPGNWVCSIAISPSSGDVGLQQSVTFSVYETYCQMNQNGVCMPTVAIYDVQAPVNWSIDNSSIGSLSTSTGNSTTATGLSAGSATITARDSTLGCAPVTSSVALNVHPLSVQLSGPTYAATNAQCNYSASSAYGSGTLTYSWYTDGELLGPGQVEYPSDGNYQVEVEVVDGLGQHATALLNVSAHTPTSPQFTC